MGPRVMRYTARYLHAAATGEIDQSVVEFARLGWVVCNDFLLPIPNIETFDAVMRDARQWNSFHPDRIRETVGSLVDESGGVGFGRDDSPLLHFDVPFSTGQTLRFRRDNADGDHVSVPLDENDRVAYADRVVAWGESMGADEVTVRTVPAMGVPPEAGPSTPDRRVYGVEMWWD